MVLHDAFILYNELDTQPRDKAQIWGHLPPPGTTLSSGKRVCQSASHSSTWWFALLSRNIPSTFGVTPFSGSSACEKSTKGQMLLKSTRTWRLRSSTVANGFRHRPQRNDVSGEDSSVFWWYFRTCRLPGISFGMK